MNSQNKFGEFKILWNGEINLMNFGFHGNGEIKFDEFLGLWNGENKFDELSIS